QNLEHLLGSHPSELGRPEPARAVLDLKRAEEPDHRPVRQRTSVPSGRTASHRAEAEKTRTSLRSRGSAGFVTDTRGGGLDTGLPPHWSSSHPPRAAGVELSRRSVAAQVAARQPARPPRSKGVFVSTAVRPFTGSYDIDPVHSSVQFAVEHIVSTFRASFDEIE